MDKEVVEFAPGLGRTAQIIIDSGVVSYVGIDQDPAAVARADSIVSPFGGRVVQNDVQHTGLDGESADVVIGEAMLTMQGAKTKNDIVHEAFRLLRPGGCYAIHELALTPNEIATDVAEELRKQLARTIRVNARPLTPAEWDNLLTQCGFSVEWSSTAPMALLSLKRNLADEGISGVARILWNVARDKDLRQRVLQMRSTFTAHKNNLAGIAIIARNPAS